MLFGYKCFNDDLTNNYGFQFKVGESYSVDGEIKTGLSGNGYHMCENIEDTFRYCGAMNPKITVCEVIGSGKMASAWDDYYGYATFAVEKIEIVRELDRDEIIEMALNMSDTRVTRFVQVFRLNSDEIKMFEVKFAKFPRVLDAIAYYQKGDLDVYKRTSLGYVKKRVKED